MGAALEPVVVAALVPDVVPAPLAMDEAVLITAAAVAGDMDVLAIVIGVAGAVATGGHWVAGALGDDVTTGVGAAGVVALGAAGVGFAVVTAAAVLDCKLPPATQAAKLF